ncbi:MAG: hypothetical protein HC773_05250, partial [Scytonema sp. CRU_2_7]|nr:hypothetical protein [Scytonema sp. CRU_2_7]
KGEQVLCHKHHTVLINRRRSQVLKGDAGFDYVESRLVETAAGIRFGLAVKPGTDAGTQVAVVTAGASIEGVTVHQHVEKDYLTGTALYKQYEVAGIMRRGLIWMRVSGTAPVVNAPVYAMVDTALDAGFATGLAGTNNILIPTAVCKKLSTDPDGSAIALVEINIP